MEQLSTFLLVTLQEYKKNHKILRLFRKNAKIIEVICDLSEFHHFLSYDCLLYLTLVFDHATILLLVKADLPHLSLSPCLLPLGTSFICYPIFYTIFQFYHQYLPLHYFFLLNLKTCLGFLHLTKRNKSNSKDKAMIPAEVFPHFLLLIISLFS